MEKINFQNLPSTDTPINSTNLNQMQDNIEEAINIVKEDSGWKELTETGESYAHIKYRKIGKMLEINSNWYSETGISVNAYGELLLGTLPEGFRPSKGIVLPIMCKNNLNVIINACNVKINTNGTIQISNLTGSAASNICVIWFHTMCFVD